MRIQLLSMLLLLIITGGCQQTKTATIKSIVSFDQLISHYEAYNPNDTIHLPVIYSEKDFKIVLSDDPLVIKLADTVLKNPYGYSFPLSYSVIFQNNLVALFKPGKFVCYDIETLERNSNLEIKLNKKKFSYHCLLNNQLIARTGNSYFYFDGESWQSYIEKMPFKDQPKLFEDENYICYAECNGEFGGTIYFFNKNTKKVYFTEATCANTVVKKDDKYQVLSHLGHMSGSSSLVEIADPEQLSELTKETRRSLGGMVSDTPTNAKRLFRLWGFQFYSTFSINQRCVYLTYWNGRTVLAEHTDSTLSIVHPLFNDGLYTHEPVTTFYPGYTMVNMNFGTRIEDKEGAILLIKGDRLTRINWNEKNKD